MTEFVDLRPTKYSYPIDDEIGDKKAKVTKKCVRKRILKFEDYKKCLQNNKIILKFQQRFKSEVHNVFTQEIKLLKDVTL